jgi:tRNA(Ile)-lysidine synthase
METFLQNLERALEQMPLPERAPRISVAFSGGLDSTVLLTAMSRLSLAVPVRALHIDHGLHDESGDWSRHCREIAAALGVEFDCRVVTVPKIRGRSLEATARELRYAELLDMMDAGELLLTAHHSDDQLETILLRLMRGSGAKGLRCISSFRAMDKGYLGRPLLSVSHDEILRIGSSWKLCWLNDPSNPDQRFDRNYLRHAVIPLLKDRWPGASVTAGRTAAHMREVQEILDSVGVTDAKRVGALGGISQSSLLELSRARLSNVLRYLVLDAGLAVPTSMQLRELLSAVQITRPDARTYVQWPGGEARLYAGQLYLSKPIGSSSGPNYEGRLDLRDGWSGPEGRLSLRSTDGIGLPDLWVKEGLTVRFQSGGERFRPCHDVRTRKLKKWFRDAGVFPWMRARVPLLYRGATLVAVGDLWLSDALSGTPASAAAWKVIWSDHPPIT